MPDNASPPRPTPPGLSAFWTKPLRDVATLRAEPIEPGLRERHRLYSLLTMAVVASQFNGNKHGDRGDYGDWRAGQREPGVPAAKRMYGGGTYLGHNIAAVAVDARGNVVDYDFNHNDLFNSSVEHAESRLVRRLFSLAQIFDPWRQWKASAGAGAGADDPGIDPSVAPRTFLFTARPDLADGAGLKAGPRRQGYGTLLADVTIYTSLESCAQCSGIMALANVREIVYLQYDQGQYLIGNLMYRATRGSGPGGPKGSGAPRPIPGSDFDFAWYDQLNAANIDFAKGVAKAPFYQEPGFSDRSASITSFLCTDRAREIYRDAATSLDATAATEHPDYRRLDHAGHPVDGALSNAGVLSAVKRFLDYARSQGGRGTQHRV